MYVDKDSFEDVRLYFSTFLKAAIPWIEEKTTGLLPIYCAQIQVQQGENKWIFRCRNQSSVWLLVLQIQDKKTKRWGQQKHSQMVSSQLWLSLFSVLFGLILFPPPFQTIFIILLEKVLNKQRVSNKFPPAANKWNAFYNQYVLITSCCYSK